MSVIRFFPIIRVLGAPFAVEIAHECLSVALAQPETNLAARSDAGTSRDGGGPALFEGSGIVCVTPYSLDPGGRKTISYPENVDMRRRHTWSYWRNCQKCPDARGKCDPCDADSLVKATSFVIQDLHFVSRGTRACPLKDLGLLEHLHLPSHPGRDEVWLQLADLYYFDCDRPKLATENYRRLIRKDTDARVVAHAALALGEILFSQGEWTEAEKLFGKSANLATGSQRLCATYRHSWALARLGQVGLARKGFRACALAPRTDPFSAFVGRTCDADERRLSP